MYHACIHSHLSLQEHVNYTTSKYKVIHSHAHACIQHLQKPSPIWTAKIATSRPTAGRSPSCKECLVWWPELLRGCAPTHMKVVAYDQMINCVAHMQYMYIHTYWYAMYLAR